MKVYDIEAGGESFVIQEDLVLDTWKGEYSKLYNVITEDFKFNDDFKNFIMNEKHQLGEEIESVNLIENKMLNVNISHLEVEKATAASKLKKVTGVDHIPNKALKHSDVIDVAHAVYNLCLSKSVLPEIWKMAIIKPIPKRASKDSYVPLNYRGISLLCCLNKFYTSILTKRLKIYLDYENLIEEQNGFM